MADATDSKSVVRNHVWVQVPPSAPMIWYNAIAYLKESFLTCLSFRFFILLSASSSSEDSYNGQNYIISYQNDGTVSPPFESGSGTLGSSIAQDMGEHPLPSFTTGDLESLYSVGWIVCQSISIMKRFVMMTQIRNSGPRETSQGTLIMCVIKRNHGPMDVSGVLTFEECLRVSWNDI